MFSEDYLHANKKIDSLANQKPSKLPRESANPANYHHTYCKILDKSNFSSLGQNHNPYRHTGTRNLTCFRGTLGGRGGGGGLDKGSHELLESQIFIDRKSVV